MEVKRKIKNQQRKKESNHRILWGYISCLVVAGVLIVAICTLNFANEVSIPQNVTIAIDPGHGGIDVGASGNGAVESVLNLQIAEKLQAEICQLGFESVMTRTGDYGLYGDTSAGFKLRDLQARKAICESSNATLVVSVHQNSSSIPNRTGTVIYCDFKDSESVALANAIASQIENCKVKSGDFYITREVDMPAVIVECGFISTIEEAALLSGEEYQAELADKIASGILCYLVQNA